MKQPLSNEQEKIKKKKLVKKRATCFLEQKKNCMILK